MGNITETSSTVKNISNLRKNIAISGVTSKDYLPLWMKSVQSGSFQELGWKLCIPVCYCKPGTASNIISAINFSKFDYRKFDLDIDRVLVHNYLNTTDGDFLLFRNRYSPNY